MIPFNKPPFTNNEKKYILEAIKSDKISGNGNFTQKCHNWFKARLNCEKVLLTPSCTAALEMSALLIDVRPGDEIIMPSYTFVSTANAFVLRGAIIKFIDINPRTMNIDESKIEQAITKKTKAIVPVHYAGVGCEMDTVKTIAQKHNVFVIEDAAQGIMAKYKNRYLGVIGHFGCYSFHETKNITSGGEGGLLIINDERFKEKAEIIWEKGTNRCKFFRGEIDKYTWVNIGSSYLMSELQAAYLWGQLEKIEEITAYRLKVWNFYYENLKDLENKGFIKLPTIPKNCQHNGHMFYIRVKNIITRDNLIKFLRNNNIYAVFHYVPLHSSPAGKNFGEFIGEDQHTTKESEKLIRLPLYYKIKKKELEYIVEKFYLFFRK
jgi:dTDP-4-amino-4,6-dideoxygalactose transaminase